MRANLVLLAVGLALAGALASGCVPTRDAAPRDRLSYLPPSGLPPVIRPAFVAAPPAFTVDRLAERLRRAGLRVQRVDPEAGLVVALYSGDPDPYVDCGWIVVSAPDGGGQPEQLAAARQEASFRRSLDGEPVVFERTLRLDGRLVASVAPTARGSLVDPTANYVLTKTVEVVGPDGGTIRRESDTTSFSTGRGGEFEAGTICQPTARFEALVLDDPASGGVIGAGGPVSPPPALAAEVREVLASFACPDVDVAFGPGNAVLAFGYVPDAFSQTELRRQLELIPGIGPVETRLDVHSPEFCQALEIAAPFRGGPDGGADGLRVRAVAPDGEAILEEGDEVVLEIAAPTPDSHVRVDLVAADGRVVHLADGPAAALGGAASGDDGDVSSFRYATGYAAEPPFGRALVLAIATDRPLFFEPRPRAEAAEAYLPELRRRVEALRAAGLPVAADYAVVTTRRAEGV